MILFYLLLRPFLLVLVYLDIGNKEGGGNVQFDEHAEGWGHRGGPVRGGVVHLKWYLIKKYVLLYATWAGMREEIIYATCKLRPEYI